MSLVNSHKPIVKYVLNPLQCLTKGRGLLILSIKGILGKGYTDGCMDVATSASATILRFFFDILLNDWVDQAEILSEGLT